MPNLKILSDTDCIVFIDKEKAAEVSANVLAKIPLDKGEYYIEIISLIHNSLCHKVVLLIEYDRFLNTKFIPTLLASPVLWNDLHLIPDKNEDGLFGYIVAGTEITLIPHIYEKADFFVETFAIVKKGAWGGYQ